ncbi:MAG: hypothetical protein IT489_09140 [Gammaproteobacteria bacterium]|nr:hypothetical protein [Gammaproteobacteria bacterium]
MSLPAEPMSRFDPELPDAGAVMASLCCVATQYASRPSVELARTALNLAHKLTTAPYAETEQMAEVAQQLVRQWDQLLCRHMNAFGVTLSGCRSVN